MKPNINDKQKTNMRLLIRADEVMEITGWKKTKTYAVLSMIREIYDYKAGRKDVSIADFCDYTGIPEKDVRASIGKKSV
jgi:hypothetical protein